jgi:hypothetical protein
MSTPEPPPYPSGDDANDPSTNQPGYPPPPPADAPPYGQPAGHTPTVVPGAKQATTSLVTGILGLLCCFLLGIVAIVTGRQATAEAAAAGLPQPGNAKAGIILGWVSIGLTVAGLIVYVLLFIILGVATTMSDTSGVTSNL